MANSGSKAIENLLQEDRIFPPPEAFSTAANAQPSIYDEADADYLAFWRREALERIDWIHEPTVTLDDSEAPFFKWFEDQFFKVYRVKEAEA